MDLFVSFIMVSMIVISVIVISYWVGFSIGLDEGRRGEWMIQATFGDKEYVERAIRKITEEHLIKHGVYDDN